jgi:Ca2+-binding EF-hand superfamily protein
MTRFLKPVTFATSILLALAVPQSVAAQTVAPSPPSQPVPEISPATKYLSQRLFQGQTLDTYLQQLHQQFRHADADMNGVVDAADIEIHAKIGAASMRNMIVMMIMRADLNGDGIVSEDELRRLLRYERRQNIPPSAAYPPVEDPIEAEVKTLMEADADHDGRITYAEAVGYSKSRPDYLRAVPTLIATAQSLMVFAPEGKSAVTLADIEPAAEALFRLVDTDGDGKLSQDEIKTYRSRPDQPEEQARRAAQARMAEREQKKREAQETRKKAEEAHAKQEAEARIACVMPKASDAAKVVLLGAYQTEALSSVTIGYQDVSVGVGNVMVEPGSEPIYLVIASYRPTIWRFYGAVERIERLVLTSMVGEPDRAGSEGKPLVGATGLPAERVTFFGKSRCIAYFTEAPSSTAAIAAGLIKRELGKDVATVAGRYSFADVSVPSSRFQTTKDSDAGKLVIIKPAGSLKIEGNTSNVIVRTGPSSLESELMRFNPGGVVEVDPKRVIASMPVERYEVLPQQAGLLQLVKSGKLAQNGHGEFLIKEKIRFPAELSGAHSVKFLLMRGVPVPDGDPGHCDVISEETGESIKFEPAKR